jgi:hypothetical protein
MKKEIIRIVIQIKARIVRTAFFIL